MQTDGFTDIDANLASYELTNFATFAYYAMRLKSLAQTAYKWQNLPDSIDPEALERFLLLHGKVGFAKDDVSGELIALPVVPKDNLNIYGVPKGHTMNAINGYRLDVDSTNSVICWDNYNKRPIFGDLLMFAKRLEIIERTMDVNISGQRTPYIIRGSKAEIQTLKDVYRKMEANAPVIFADKSLELESISVTPTVTPFIAADLQNIKRNIWNEAMTFLGVQNANTEKRERLVEEEAVGNKGMIDNQLFARLKPRVEACERINAMFGTNISCDVNVVDLSEEVYATEEEGGVDGGEDVPEAEE